MAEPADKIYEPLPAFSSADIVKLYASTFLPLCEVLADSGLATYAQIAQTISSHVPEADNDAWAQLARALIGVLERAPDQTQNPDQTEACGGAPTQGAPAGGPHLTLVSGGRP